MSKWGLLITAVLTAGLTTFFPLRVFSTRQACTPHMFPQDGVPTDTVDARSSDGAAAVTANGAGIPGWYQEAHDAQHTGYTPEDVPLPWTFAWQWNGSCADGSDCRPGDPEEGWTFPIPARAHLVAGGGRLYLPAGEHGVWAINESDGRTAWHNGAIQSYCTAAFDLDSNGLFVAAADGRLYRLNPSNGAVVGYFQADSGLNLAPTIAAGRVYVVSDNGTLYAVDKDTMQPAWSYVAGSPGQTPASYSVRYGLLVFGTEDLYVHAVNDFDGSLRWCRKPTVHTPGDLTYDGGDGRMHRTHNYEYGWPVIAEEHGVVLIRLRLPKSAIWEVPNPSTANWFPSSNSDIRSFLMSRPDLQPLFALRLSDGGTAFIPAVGTGGNETPDIDNTLGTVPILRTLPSGDEVAYIVWRNGQKCEAGDCSDPRWDAVMGEMVLDGSTVPGYQAGDLRFVAFGEGSTDGLITDELAPLTMAGDVLLYAHTLALRSYRITDRSSGRGNTYGNPIPTERQGFVVTRASNEPDWVTCQPGPGHSCTGWLDTYCDRRVYQEPFWVFFNDMEPPAECRCSGSDCVAPDNRGYSPKYAIVHNGAIYFELSSGAIFAVRSANEPRAAVQKQALPSACSSGDTVVYTVRVLGNGQALTLTDSLPGGLSAPNPVATQGTVDYNPTSRVITWSGMPQLGEWATIMYTVTVQETSATLVLGNTAVLTDAEGMVSTDAAVVIVNGTSVYIPMAMRFH